MGESSIEWTDRVWNPTVGCTKVSAGCKHCYAETMHARLTRMGNSKYADPFRVVKPAPAYLADPLGWKKPARIFVNSMSDLFHEDVPDEYIAAVFGVMAASSQHTFQVLTKRAERMATLFAKMETDRTVKWGLAAGRPLPDCGWLYQRTYQLRLRHQPGAVSGWVWPIPNVWLGVSVENQEQADARIPHLLRTPAAVRFLSCEPLLGPVDLNVVPRGGTPVNGFPPSVGAFARWQERPTPAKLRDGVDWVIVGGESGHGARRHNVEWTRSIVKQCRDAGVPVFVKQMGENIVDRNDRFNTCQDTGAPADWWPLDDPDRVEDHINGFREEYQGAPVRIRLRDKKGGDPAEWPEDLRVREWPEAQS